MSTAPSYRIYSSSDGKIHNTITDTGWLISCDCAVYKSHINPHGNASIDDTKKLVSNCEHTLRYVVQRDDVGILRRFAPGDHSDLYLPFMTTTLHSIVNVIVAINDEGTEARVRLPLDTTKATEDMKALVDLGFVPMTAPRMDIARRAAEALMALACCACLSCGARIKGGERRLPTAPEDRRFLLEAGCIKVNSCGLFCKMCIRQAYEIEEIAGGATTYKHKTSTSTYAKAVAAGAALARVPSPGTSIPAWGSGRFVMAPW